MQIKSLNIQQWQHEGKEDRHTRENTENKNCSKKVKEGKKIVAALQMSYTAAPAQILQDREMGIA